MLPYLKMNNIYQFREDVTNKVFLCFCWGVRRNACGGGGVAWRGELPLCQLQSNKRCVRLIYFLLQQSFIRGKNPTGEKNGRTEELNNGRVVETRREENNGRMEKRVNFFNSATRKYILFYSIEYMLCYVIYQLCRQRAWKILVPCAADFDSQNSSVFLSCRVFTSTHFSVKCYQDTHTKKGLLALYCVKFSFE